MCARFERQPRNILFCTTRSANGQFREGGVRIPFERTASEYRCFIPGPEDPLGSGKDLRGVHSPPQFDGAKAEIKLDSENFKKVGEYSEWVPVKFKAGLGFSARGLPLLPQTADSRGRGLCDPGQY
jgi:hypothetical protein